ncbi:MAG: methionyl-tRNA formyltransferase [Dehalococcoidia bacterium]
MRIALFGQAAFGRDVLTALREAGEEVVGVSTPRPGARPDALQQAAEEAGLPVIPTRDLRQAEAFEAYRAWDAELLVFAFVTDIVRKNVLDAAPRGAIQYHPSLLPLHRGRSSIAWPIIAGEATTGVTIFWVDEGIDSGPVLLQREVEIGAQDSVATLYFDRLYPMGVEMLVESVALVRAGDAPRIEQDHLLATYEPPLGPEHGAIDWSRPGAVVFNHVRGCDPTPGASARAPSGEVRLFNARLAPAMPEEAPGTVVAAGEGGSVDIAVIGGVMTVERMQPEGGGKVAAAEVVNVGDRLERVP